MEFSEIFGFLIILKESNKLLRKTWKFMASVATLSLILPSLFFLLFSCFYQALMDDIINRPDSGFKSTILLLAAEIVFFFVFVVVSHFSGISIIIASAISYPGKDLSSEDLFSRVKRTWRSPLKTRLRLSTKSIIYGFFVAGLTALVVIMDLINPITISLLILLLITLTVFALKSSVVNLMALVVSIVEESFEGRQAMEKAERLVEGQRLHGFLLNLFFNIVAFVCFLVFWMILGDKGSLNLTIYGLLFVNFNSLLVIYISTVYTVFYFQCKKHHGEEVDVPGDIQYIRLPTSTLELDLLEIRRLQSIKGLGT